MRFAPLVPLLAAGLWGAFAAHPPKSRDIQDMFHKDTLPQPVVPKKPRVSPSGPSKRPDPATLPVSAPSRRRVGLRYRLQMESAAGAAADVDAARIFRSGEAVRLIVDSNIDGFLYVLLTGSSGKQTLLFPHPDINGGLNRVTAGVPYTVPAGGWFRFDATPGEERLLLAVSRAPLENLPTRVTPDEAKPVVGAEVLMAELNRQVRSRDLVFVKEETPAAQPGAPPVQAVLWVNASDTDNQTVYATVVLQHR